MMQLQHNYVYARTVSVAACIQLMHRLYRYVTLVQPRYSISSYN
jgi:hypothetical protein